jgi:hypothetical protein
MICSNPQYSVRKDIMLLPYDLVFSVNKKEKYYKAKFSTNLIFKNN